MQGNKLILSQRSFIYKGVIYSGWKKCKAVCLKSHLACILSASEFEKVELITNSILQRIIKKPVLQLKAACKRGEAETLIDALSELFNLEQKIVEIN